MNIDDTLAFSVTGETICNHLFIYAKLCTTLIGICTAARANYQPGCLEQLPDSLFGRRRRIIEPGVWCTAHGAVLSILRSRRFSTRGGGATCDVRITSLSVYPVRTA